MATRSASNARRRPEGQSAFWCCKAVGALGAYQAGAYEALAAAATAPNWVAGISIGAINGALIAGNPPENRVARLREFWETTTSVSALIAPPTVPSVEARRALNQVNASIAVLCGLLGFFLPRFPPAPLHMHGTPGALSFYDTSPLRQTLNRLVDFDLLNNGPVRLSVGAVNVRTGNFAYSTPPSKFSIRATSWPAAHSRPDSHRSKSTANRIGTEVWCRTPRCSMCSISPGPSPDWFSRLICSRAKVPCPPT